MCKLMSNDEDNYLSAENPFLDDFWLSKCYAAVELTGLCCNSVCCVRTTVISVDNVKLAGGLGRVRIWLLNYLSVHT